MKTGLTAMFAALLGLAMIPSAHAQPLSSRPLRIVVPYSAGGLMDLTGRQLSRFLAEKLGQPVFVENIVGASGAVGIASVRKAEPDGLSLILLEPGVVITPLLDPAVGFNLARDLEPVSIVAEAPLILAVNADVKAQSLSEFLALLRVSSGQFNFASGGVGTAPHMAGELLKAQTKVDIVHVPYRGVASSLVDIAGGRVQMIFAGAADLQPYVQDGRMRALGSSGSRRSRLLPDAPTFAEAGLPDVRMAVWVGLFVAKGTPPTVIDRLRKAIAAVAANEEFRKVLARADFEAMPLAGEDARSFLVDEERKWREVVETNRLR